MTMKNLGKNCPVSMLYNIVEPDQINVIISLTLLSRMKLPTFIKWTSPFSSSGLLGVVFHSYSNFNKTSCKQPVESLIKHCSLRASDLDLYYLSMFHKKNAKLIWVKYFVVYVTHITCIVSSSNWIMIEYRAVLSNEWAWRLPYVGQKPLRLKQFCTMARFNVCFNIPFPDLISSIIVNKKGNFRN